MVLQMLQSLFKRAFMHHTDLLMHHKTQMIHLFDTAASTGTPGLPCCCWPTCRACCLLPAGKSSLSTNKSSSSIDQPGFSAACRRNSLRLLTRVGSATAFCLGVVLGDLGRVSRGGNKWHSFGACGVDAAQQCRSACTLPCCKKAYTRICKALGQSRPGQVL